MTAARSFKLSLIVAIALGLAVGQLGCGDTAKAPTAPTANVAVSVQQESPSTVKPGVGPVGVAGGNGQGAVAFPPRNEPFEFGNTLNSYYRDTLRRSSVSTYVDLEGYIVWIQEYLRYRVNACSHADAIARVFTQIGGFGVPSACGEAPAGTVAFAPRDQTMEFGRQLNAYYRDSMRRSPVDTYVDLEGWVVWIQEYLRYRVNACDHTVASSKVFLQIAGGGVQPVCNAGPPPTAGGFIRVQGGSNACSCWIGTITVQIDGVAVGTLTCSTSNTFAASVGSHTVKACDSTGCGSATVTVAANVTAVVTLGCGGITESLREVWLGR